MYIYIYIYIYIHMYTCMDKYACVSVCVCVVCVCMYICMYEYTYVREQHTYVNKNICEYHILKRKCILKMYMENKHPSEFISMQISQCDWNGHVHENDPKICA